MSLDYNEKNMTLAILEGYDLKVIRFTNRQINANFPGVCEDIDAAVKVSLSGEPLDALVHL